MEFDKIAERAHKGIGYEKLWNLPKKHADMQLEKLYYNYKLGSESKESCVAEKARIRKEYEQNEVEYNRHLDICREYDENRIKHETLLIDLEKAECKDDVIKPALQIIADLVNDDYLVERITEKILKMQ